jgi:hypothetical protein
MRRFVVLTALLLVGTISNAQAAPINFEDHAVAPGTATPDFSGAGLTSGGFSFETVNVYQLANANASDNGSTYMVLEDLPADNPTRFSPIDGAPFALISMDVSEWQTNQSYARTVEVTGNLFGGGSVSTVLTLNGDFNDQLIGNYFQTFTFDAAWGNLSSVVLNGSGATSGNYYAIDNVVVGPAATTVPEPGTLSLLSLGSVFLVGRRRRQNC